MCLYWELGLHYAGKLELIMEDGLLIRTIVACRDIGPHCCPPSLVLLSFLLAELFVCNTCYMYISSIYQHHFSSLTFRAGFPISARSHKGQASLQVKFTNEARQE